MRKVLSICDYTENIKLYEEYLFIPTTPKNKELIVNDLLVELNELNSLNFSYSDNRRLLHAKINTLYPNAFNSKAINNLNQLLNI